MGVGSFSVGQRLFIDGKAMRITRQFDLGFFELEDLSTGRHEEWSLFTLQNHWKDGKLQFKNHLSQVLDKKEISDLLNAYADEFRNTYSGTAWAKARMKLEFVFRLEDCPVYKKVMEPRVLEIWQDDRVWEKVQRPSKVPSWTTVAGWLRKYRKHDRDARALIDQELSRGNQSERFPEEVIEIADDFIETVYMTIERPTQAEVLERIRGKIAKINTTRPSSLALPKPGKKFLKNQIKEIDAFDLYASRYGVDAANEKFRGSGKGPQADRPMQRVEIDHNKMNLFCIDDKDFLPLGRPWLTLLLDAYTRNVTGYYVGFIDPSSVSVAEAIRHALGPKTLSAEVVHSWDAWGIFDVLVADNGMELHGEIVERGCAQFGIKIQYCPRKKPWFKGKIERFFRTMDMGLTGNIEGKTFSNILERDDYDPSKHAVVTLSTLKKIIEIWIVDYYHQKKHRGLKKSPAQAWDESIGKVDRYLPDSSLLLDSAFCRLEKRRLTKDGIEFDGLFYQCEDLRRIRERLGDRINVEIRVMDDNLGWIVVCVPDSNTVVRVPAVELDYADGLLRYTHGVCKRYQRNKYEQANEELTLYEAKMRIQDLIAHDVLHIKRASRARQKKFMGDKPLRPQAAPAKLTEDIVQHEEVKSAVAHETAASESVTAPPPATSRDVPTFEPIVHALEQECDR